MFKAAWMPYGVVLCMSFAMVMLYEAGLYTGKGVVASGGMFIVPVLMILWMTFFGLNEVGDKEDMRGAVAMESVGICAAILAILSYAHQWSTPLSILLGSVTFIMMGWGILVGTVDPRLRYSLPSIVALLPAGPLTELFLTETGSSLSGARKVALLLLIAQVVAFVYLMNYAQRSGLLARDPH